MLINISTSKQNQAVVTKLTAKLTGSTKESKYSVKAVL